MLSIGVGSKTSTGGVVIEGNPGILFDGLVASSIGHKATCPACKKGIGEIVAVGPRTLYLPAGPAARAGDYIACGCKPGANKLIPQGTISIDGNPPSQESTFSRTLVHGSFVTEPQSYSPDGESPATAPEGLTGQRSIDFSQLKIEELDVKGATLPEETAHQAQQENGKNATYKWHIAQKDYIIKQLAYLPTEGVGVNGTFFIKGSLNFIDHEIFISAMGFSAAQRMGKTTFHCSATIELNGVEIASIPFQQGKEAGIWPADEYSPIGTVTVALPEPKANDTIQISLSGGYTYSSPEGRAVPIPSMASQTITISSTEKR